jgi:AraC-like DNA-binding protein
MLSVALYVVIIPAKQEFHDYKRARRILGFAMALIAIMNIFRLLFPATEKMEFLDVSIVLVACMAFTSLNFISFLYMIESSRPYRKLSKKVAIISSILAAAVGLTCSFIPSSQFYALIAMTALYAYVCVFLFTRCIREYDKFTLMMDNYYDIALDIKWVPDMLWCTFVLAFLMAANFFYAPLSFFTAIGSIVIYTFLSMKLLSFVPNNINIVRKSTIIEEDIIINYEPKAKKKVEVIETEEEENKEEAKKPVVVVNEAEIRKFQKIEGMVNNWISEDKFTRPEISIRDVAMEIGTNTNYLSGYINKVLKTTFTSWLNTLRIEKSKEYLCGKERISIEECGSKVGYLSIYNYSRWFKLITGMSPSEWRKNQCER